MRRNDRDEETGGACSQHRIHRRMRMLRGLDSGRRFTRQKGPLSRVRRCPRHIVGVAELRRLLPVRVAMRQC